MATKLENEIINAIQNGQGQKSSLVPVVFIVLMVLIFLAANSQTLFGFDITALFGL